MSSNKYNNSFIKFLKDDRFIEWMIYQSEDMNLYWENFIKQNPQEKENILQAKKHFSQIDFSSHKLSHGKKQYAIKKLETSIKEYKRKRIIRHFSYAAAIIVILFSLVLHFQKKTDHDNRDRCTTDYLTGRQMDSKDILFITGQKTTSFQNNVDIAIEGDKKAQVISSQEEESKEIYIEQSIMNKLIVPHGKRSKIILSDGTIVWLNSGSTLEFPSDFSKNIREVYLSGEMYFEVAPDAKRPFIVHTSDYHIRVHGTEFNVNTYNQNSSSVVLVSGSISLASDETDRTMLKPNQQALFSGDTGKLDIQEVDVTPYISWKDGYLTFEETPAIEVLKQIERYYNLSLNYEDGISFKGLTCTGKIILSENLDQVMTTFSVLSSTKYKREDRLIYLYK